MTEGAASRGHWGKQEGCGLRLARATEMRTWLEFAVLASREFVVRKWRESTFSSFSHVSDAGMAHRSSDFAMRCLLVEDYTPLRLNLAECLTENGYVVDASATGDEGLWFAENQTCDVILLDALLEYLMNRAGQAVSRTDIWEHVYEDQEGGSSNTVDVYIGYLRKKLNVGDGSELIQTVRGYGYMLKEAEA